MAQSVLSDFWRTDQHDHDFDLPRLGKEIFTLSEWQKMTPLDLALISYTIEIHLDHYSNTGESQSIERMYWKIIEDDYLTAIQSKIADFEPRFTAKCLRGLAKLKIEISPDNIELYKKTISLLLEQASVQIQDFNLDDLSDLAVALCKAKPNLDKIDQLPTDKLWHDFFMCAARLIEQPGSVFNEMHFTDILNMSGTHKIFPPANYAVAAIIWAEKNIIRLNPEQTFTCFKAIQTVEKIDDSGFAILTPSLQRQMDKWITNSPRKKADSILKYALEMFTI